PAARDSSSAVSSCAWVTARCWSRMRPNGFLASWLIRRGSKTLPDAIRAGNDPAIIAPAGRRPRGVALSILSPGGHYPEEARGRGRGRERFPHVARGRHVLVLEPAHVRAERVAAREDADDGPLRAGRDDRQPPDILARHDLDRGPDRCLL